MSPKLFYGPATWHRAPNSNIALRNDMEIVEVIMTANFWNVISLPPKRDIPQPRVVIVPLRILTPISEYAYWILSCRDGFTECL